MSRRLLAVLAHPDDETFLMGGTLAMLAERGWSVWVLTVTDGDRGRRGPYQDADLSAAAFGALRREELEAACRALGAHALPGIGCPDGGVATCAGRMKLRNALGMWIARIRPHVVVSFGPDGVSGHADHVAVGRITRTAVREYRASAHAQGLRPEMLLVLASGALPECCLQGGDRPEPPETLHINVTATAERKLEAMAAYRSQEHLQPRDRAQRRLIGNSPERFHRLDWAGPEGAGRSGGSKGPRHRRRAAMEEVPA